MPDTHNPETEYETDAQVYDPVGYFAAPAEVQGLLDRLMTIAELDRDLVTMVAIGSASIGLWHHTKGAEIEYLTRLTLEGSERFELGPMNRGDL